jgi:LuxR family maltose regulon positive regulatory protein
MSDTEDATPAAATDVVSVVSTRTRPPRLFASPIDRGRLRRQLEHDNWKVAVVAARAAAGKTTLVASWAAGRGHPVAWLTCDRSDRDAARLVAALAAAVDAAVPDHAPATPWVAGALAAGPDAENAPLAERLAAHIDALGTPLAVVIDDYHLLDPQTAAPVVAALVDDTPEHVRIVLVGRGRPPLRLARLQVQRRAVVLGDEDLVFDDDEAAAMLRDTLGLDLSDVDARAVARRCEGWAGGLCLVALALQRRGGDVGAVLDSMQRHGGHVADLLLDEVLGAMDPDDVDFLLRVSLLDRLDPNLCAAVTGRRDARRRLEALHQAIGFVVAVDDDHAPYALHALFRDVLRDRADAVLDHEVGDVHARAAAWLEGHGYDEEAIDHLLAAGDVGRAIAAIRRVRTNPVTLADAHSQLRWLEALPEGVVSAHRDLWAGLLMCRFTVHGELPAGRVDPASASEAAVAFVAAAMAADLAEEQRLASATYALAQRSDPTMVHTGLAFRVWTELSLDRLDAIAPLLTEAASQRHQFDIVKVVMGTVAAAAADARHDADGVFRAAEPALAAHTPQHDRYQDMKRLPAALVAEHRGDVTTALAELYRFVEGDPTSVWPRLAFMAWLRIADLESAAGAIERASSARARATAVLASMRTPGPWVERVAAAAGIERAGRHAGVAPPEIPPAASELSNRERQVFRLLRGDLSLREIADELYVSHNTIKTHAKNIYRKLGVSQRSELRLRTG